MTRATARPATARWPEATSAGAAHWRSAAAILAALCGIVGARWLGTMEGLDGLLVGACFGLALAAVCFVADPAVRAHGTSRPAFGARRIAQAAPLVAIGVAFGLVLVVGASVGAAIGGFPTIPGMGRPAAPFVPWVAITILVASAEEGILRGVLFDRLRLASGTIVAVAVSTLAFALLHVPLYGWHVVPLDLAVGLGFAGLRLATGSIAAPAAAHAVADLATWWL